MKNLIAITICCVFLFCHHSANAMSVNKLRELDENSAFWYLNGVINGTTFIFDYDFPEGTTNGQIMAVVNKYIQGHPAEWHEPVALTVIKALGATYKIRSKNSKK